MELKILWLYHDLKDVFGDAGNIQVLKKRCERRGISCHIETCGIGDEIDMTAFDLIYFGTNIHGKDSYVLQDLVKRKQNIKNAMNKGIFFFLVCGGYQAFGQEYLYEDDTVKGLDILSFRVDYRKKANCIGNAYVRSSLVEEVIIGFENHHYQILENPHPMGSILMGKGNDLTHLEEGYFYENVVGTNLHGPLLPKNPQLADKIIYMALSRENDQVMLDHLEDVYEEKARTAIQKRFHSVS